MEDFSKIVESNKAKTKDCSVELPNLSAIVAVNKNYKTIMVHTAIPSNGNI